jgi:hypothetical protein
MLKVPALLLPLMLGLALPAIAREGSPFHLVFVPDGGAADYVATFREIRAERTGEPRAVFQRAGLTRVEISQRDGKAVTFEGRSQPTFINLFVDESGRYRWLQIEPPNERSFSTAQAVKTDRQQSFLNETCRIWHITHKSDTFISILRESCVTDDGVELWHKMLLQDGFLLNHVEATSVERRPVTDLEVLPPTDLLNLRSWGVTDDQTLSNAPKPADFETTFRHAESKSGTTPDYAKKVRRHFPWLRIETTTRQYRHLVFEHAVAGLRLDFRGQRNATFERLHVTRYGFHSDYELAGERLDRSETVLGERCDWFDRYPRVMDATLHQCRASDGIILKEISYSWGNQSNIEAVQVQRAPASISTAAPPEDILRAVYWRIPQ